MSCLFQIMPQLQTLPDKGSQLHAQHNDVINLKKAAHGKLKS